MGAPGRLCSTVGGLLVSKSMCMPWPDFGQFSQNFAILVSITTTVALLSEGAALLLFRS